MVCSQILIQQGEDEEEYEGQIELIDVGLQWKAINSIAFCFSCLAFLLSFSSNRGICQRVDVGELSHPAMHKRLFRIGNAVDDEANVFTNN